ncbi:hypothetical protein L6164_014497 [Bauhinia variegata]|uniref:Uncharacterized protein n=1 Tax=Bauhinia variegata TaxID=167791 RepID=A0ACB9NMC5_BAUVA|nr:hypothetical protein L6164_014497 [Bauhinia variegata]
MVPISSKQAFMVPAASAAKEKPPRPAGTTSENASKKVRFCNPGSVQGDSMESLKKMPSVRTTGDGPYGRRIEGILYKYVKDEVWIVCVCHGRFFSPAGFVKHAGGRDVENPMRRITVCPGSF